MASNHNRGACDRRRSFPIAVVRCPVVGQFHDRDDDSRGSRGPFIREYLEPSLRSEGRMNDSTARRARPWLPQIWLGYAIFWLVGVGIDPGPRVCRCPPGGPSRARRRNARRAMPRPRNALRRASLRSRNCGHPQSHHPQVPFPLREPPLPRHGHEPHADHRPHRRNLSMTRSDRAAATNPTPNEMIDTITTNGQVT